MSLPSNTPGGAAVIQSSPRSPVIPPTSTASSSSPSRRDSLPSPTRTRSRIMRPHSAGPRVIRTFEEIKVPVKTEEWYEELECGICSQILGASQAIVPCGHTFCGPCLWQWIKTNNQQTCPHCRVMVAQVTPFIANIIVDQIIERKLQNLPDGAEKVAMMMERKEKMADWKAIQLRVNPKPIYKRTREYEDDLALRLQDLPDGLRRDRQGHVRRASRNLPALGQPINHTPDLEVGAELLSTSSMRERLDELRSLRDGLYRRLETERLGLQQPNAGPVDRPYTTTIPTLHTPSAEAVRAPLIVPPNPGPNQSWPRPSFGSSVHRRSTGDGDHGTRNDPLVVLSDSSDGE